MSEDRQRDGVFRGLTVERNLTLSALSRLSRFGFLLARWTNHLARELADRLQVRPPDTDRSILTLSGGNQQKAVIGRSISLDPKVLILDEPTRGIDVGAKAEIHRLIGDFAASGVGILLISSELPEVMAASDRILVMADGRIVDEVARADAVEDRIMSAATGQLNGAPGAVAGA